MIDIKKIGVKKRPLGKPFFHQKRSLLMAFLRKHRKWIMRICMVLIFISAFFGGCSYFNWVTDMEDDNLIEEAVEDVLEHKTGLKFDFTPMSPERRF